MDEFMQNYTLDTILDFCFSYCPLFKSFPNLKDYKIFHNVEIWNNDKPIGEIDTLYRFKEFNIYIEEKSKKDLKCVQKANLQIEKFKKLDGYYQEYMGLEKKPTFYFVAYFPKDELDLEYKGYSNLF